MQRAAIFVQVHIQTHSSGAWIVQVVQPREAAGWAPVELVAAATARCRESPGSAQFPSSPVEMKRWSQAETAAGRALGEALCASAAVRAVLHEALEQARLEHRKLLVSIATADAAVRLLPWELLAIGDLPLQVSADALISRLVDGTPARPPTGPRLRVLVWAGSSAPEVLRCRDGLLQLCRQRELECVSLTDAPPPASGGASFDVLFVLAHGQLDAGLQTILGDEGAMIADDVATRLVNLVRGAPLTVMWVCHGASLSPEAIDTLAGRLAAVGAPLVVGTARKVAERWLPPWSAALLDALRGGHGLLSAVTEARLSLACDQLAHEHYRASNLVATLSRCSPEIDRRVGWLPPGWPAARREVVELMTRAFELAVKQGSGYMGIEHIMLSLKPGDLALDAVELDQLRQRISMYSADPARLADPPVSPRLRALGARLPPGVDLNQLMEALFGPKAARSRRSGGGGFNSTDGSLVIDIAVIEENLLPMDDEAGHLGAVCGLEVLLGPEDGRRILPSPGDILGRHASTDDDPPGIPLYAVTAATDRNLSRHHLRWHGAGQVELLQPGLALWRDERQLSARRGELTLQGGDVLYLTRRTTLRAVR